MMLSNKQDDIALYEVEAPHYEPVEHDAPPRYVAQPDGSYRRTSPATGRAVINCVGDMLVEEKLYRSHYINGQTDFHDIFQFVRPVFAASDLTIGNLETMVCDSAPYTGEQYKIDGKYHNNAPETFLAAIKDAGFDFLMLSNNHNIDCGVSGIWETLSRIDSMELMHTGLFPHTVDRRYALVDVNGIKLGLLAYSTWFNRNLDRLTVQGRATLINEYAQEKALVDIAAAREAGAEFVLVYIHYGTDAEYKSAPSASMRRIVQELADSGADYIVGSHTHSIQPHDLVTARDGRIVPCVYSMGNFVTSERSSISRSTGILRLTLEKADGVVRVAEEEFIPCFIPDQAYGLSYPILPLHSTGGEVLRPAIMEGETMPIAKGIRAALKKTAALFDSNCNTVGDRVLSKKNICRVLGLPEPAKNEIYTKLEYACDACKGCVALIRNRAFDPYIYTSPADCIKLADQAISKGAQLLLTDHQIKDYPCLIVPEPFEAYQSIIAAIRRQFTGFVVGITGSIGKTSTTGMVNAVVSSKYKTFSNLHNANSAIYSAKLIQQLTPEYQAYVQEIMETPPYGLAGMISKMVQPQVAIITVVGTSHMKALGSQERIRETCFSVTEGMSDDGILILNGDDPFQRDAECRQKVLYYAIENESADYRAVNIVGGETGMQFDVVYQDKRVPVKLACFGMHNVLDALAAFAAGKSIGMTDAEVVQGLAKFRTTGIRQNFVRYGGQKMFLDCYNAAAESMQSSFNAFAMIPVEKGGRKIAILGDIRETGEKDEVIHESVGKMAAESDLDVVVCYGESAGIIARTVQSLCDKKVFWSADYDEIKTWLSENVTAEDVLLFKGSRGMALERFSDALFGTWFYEMDEDAIAKAYTTTQEGLTYRVYTDHAVLTDKNTSEANVIIKSMVDGRPVMGIDQSVFRKGRSYTSSVVLPNTLVNIRYCAFYKVSRLKTVSIPQSVRIIDTSAFSTCENLEYVDIAPGCTHLGYRAFGNCKNLREITIPATVRQIGGECFLNCNKLTIRGERGSYAERYAAAHKIPFVDLTRKRRRPHKKYRLWIGKLWKKVGIKK